MANSHNNHKRRRLITGGIFLGLGLGGFFDGILLHQVLQWHNMLSNVHPPDSLAAFELNVLADGLFHVATYVFTLIGLFLLWSVARGRHEPWSTKTLIGAMLLGWGIFNVVEGIVNHHVLQTHHVRPGPNQLAWDLGFLAWGALMLVGGWFLMRPGKQTVS